MSEDEMKKLSDQYDQMAEKFQKEKDEYVMRIACYPVVVLPLQLYNTILHSISKATQ